MVKHMLNKAPDKLVKPFALTLEERRSKFWEALVEHWNQKLHKARLELETCEDEKIAASIRGRIKEIKSNLALDRDPEVTQDSSPYP